MKRLLILGLALLCGACAENPKQGGWFALRLMEKPAANGPSQRAPDEDRTQFRQILSYEKQQGDETFAQVIAQLQESDVIAYRKTVWDAYRRILSADVAAVGYRLFKYGHLAVLVQDPQQPDKLRIFSSEGFKGPNIREDLGSLRNQDFDVYRLDQWERVDRVRMNEFVGASIAKAGKWYGYDFMGVFGLVNSNMRPTDAESIGYDYICSTVVVSAFYYSGLELDAIKREGLLDLVTPAQVVDSKGRFIPISAGLILAVEEGER